MKRALFTVLLGLGAMIMTVTPGFAHHSAAMFEPTKTITVEGVVKEWQLTNPHSWLLVEVTGKDGKTVVWGFEAEGPSTLLRAGIKPSDDIFCRIARGKQQDRTLALRGPQASHDRKAIQAGKHHVEYEDVELSVLRGFEPFRAFGGNRHGVALFTQTRLKLAR